MGTPWSLPWGTNARKLLSRKNPPEIYAISDGRVRAVLRLPSMLLLQKANMGQTLRWRGGARNSCPLDIERAPGAWIDGPLSLEEFETAWNSTGHVATDEDVLAVMREEGLSHEHAIRRLRRPDDDIS